MRQSRTKPSVNNLMICLFAVVCSVCNEFVPMDKLPNCPNCPIDTSKELECPFCGRVFTEQVQLELHLSNGWCKEMGEGKGQPYQRSGKLFKLLTGRELCSVFNNNHVAEKKKKKKREAVFSLANIHIFIKHSEKMLSDLAAASKASGGRFVLRGLPASGGCVFAGQGARGLAIAQRRELKQGTVKYDFVQDFDRTKKKKKQVHSIFPTNK